MSASGYSPTTPMDLPCGCGCDLTIGQCQEVRHAVGAPAKVRANEAPQAPVAEGVPKVPEIGERLPEGRLGALIDLLPGLHWMEREQVVSYCIKLNAALGYYGKWQTEARDDSSHR